MLLGNMVMALIERWSPITEEEEKTGGKRGRSRLTFTGGCCS